MNSTQELLGIENRSNMITFHLARYQYSRNDRITSNFRFFFQQFYIIPAVKSSIKLQCKNFEKDCKMLKL